MGLRGMRSRIRRRGTGSSLPDFCVRMPIERSWSCRSSSSSNHIIGPAGDPNSMTYPELWLWRAHLGPNMLFGLPSERNAAGAELELKVQLQLQSHLPDFCAAGAAGPPPALIMRCHWSGAGAAGPAPAPAPTPAASSPGISPFHWNLAKRKILGELRRFKSMLP